MKDKLPPAMFLADSRGLDFLNSIAVPVDTAVEWLHSGEGLLSWLAQSGLVAPAVLEEVRAAAGPGELDAVTGEARALREWFRTFVDKYRGRPLSPAAVGELEPLNRVLARAEEFVQVAAKPKSEREPDEHTGLKLVQQQRWRAANALLQPVARAMAGLITEADFTQVKHCEGPACTLMFYDTTRSHARRWCSMAICGNRAKQAAHRERVALAKK
ncbi:MAG TPA: ABATE domain-containing protein [Burkholderiales bacterium]